MMIFNKTPVPKNKVYDEVREILLMIKKSNILETIDDFSFIHNC